MPSIPSWWNLEVVIAPVADVAREVYVDRLGFRLDNDFARTSTSG